MNRRDLLAIAALSTCTTVVAAADSRPTDLAKAIEDYDRATVSNDVAALANLVADDYVLVNSDSTLQDKQSYLEDFKVPGFKLDPYELQQQVHKVWGDAALLAGIVRLSWTLKGEHHERLLRIAHVWSRHDGRWRIAYTQLTRIPEQ
ncbi:MAG TPA: nuclear transport factor 2 family protein [Steroidobacteraceae bacterium]|jgi:ketosteroid isomerase-like protein|nr:nuclear transport factor 2 family protein [Steroidobacteraceae bacterium]